MKTRFRYGGTVFVALLFIFITILSLFVGVFEWSGRGTVKMSLAYYFLVRSCETATAAAVAGDSYAAGGAGYLLENEGLVVLAGYYREEDAIKVEGTMSERGVEVNLLTRALNEFSTGRENMQERQQVEGNLATLDTVSRLLFDAANGLERATATQAEAHAAVQGAIGSLEGLIEKNGRDYYSLWNVELMRIKRRAREADAGILFAKELRYLQVSLLFTILRAPAYFG